ncbi:cytochrome c oxidase assembly factor CtaG [Bacillus sp. T33-2]|uniref:cytochrome c oxidase assembly factor CtaG n=1 Tax=Bacillus sp. T33-2 TaxID=2054168 RepID=UPI000C757724|nr:cytochrome c oxidase assembly factor CtaG [Bacillus sp. T33-2]PLR97414.1 cytochrome c oxidase assembly factor CtaG [Bacillus sp. T33-2]
MLSLDIFGFRAMWSPFYFLFLAAVLAIYYLAVFKHYGLFRNGEAATRKNAVYFTVSIVLLYIIKGSPLDLLGHITFYAHMIQMAVLYLVIPPLMIFGIPHWVWRSVLGLRVVKPLFRLFTRPLIALIVFNGVFSFYHIPLIFDVVKTDMWLHAGYTTLLFILAICMWWPLLNELPEFQTLTGIKKIGYIFADGILLTPACALIIFADAPMYASFSDPQAWAAALELCVPSTTLSSLNLSGPETFSSMSLLLDQQLGGVIMKIIQEIVYGVILAQTFFSWYRKEQEQTYCEGVNGYKPPQIAE